MNVTEESIGAILTQILETTGYDFRGYRPGTIGRRIARRLALIQARDVDAYIELLRDNQAECLQLVSDLTIKVSHFFRNPYVFELMDQAIWPVLFENRRDRHIRMWSVGCACGQETYSIAISVLDYMERKKISLRNYSMTIIGTDIDEMTLESAQSGHYDEHAVGEVKKRLLDKYFAYENGYYTVVPAVKKMVTLSVHDLASPHTISPPSGVFTNYDLIFCRNVLIYFTPALQEEVLKKVLFGLNNRGYIILGESEALPPGVAGCLQVYDRRANVYQKTTV